MAEIVGRLLQEGSPLENADVTVVTGSTVTTGKTDNLGEYRIQGVPLGQSFVTLSEDYGNPWVSNSPVNVGDRVHGTTDTDYVFDCTTSGTTGGTEPVWNVGGTTTDNDVVWTAKPYYKPMIYGPTNSIQPEQISNFPTDFKSWYSFSESDGTNIIDKNGLVNGVLTDNNIRITDSKSGGGIEGDGVNYIDLASGGNPWEILSEYTICFWVNYDGNAGGSQCLFDMGYTSTGNNSDNKGLKVYIRNDGRINIRVAQNVAGSVVPSGEIRGGWSSTIVIELNVWNLVFCQRGTTQASIYIWSPTNGWISESVNYSYCELEHWWGSKPHRFLVGNNNSSDPINFDAWSVSGTKFDEVGIYDRLLTEQERKAIWNYGIRKTIPVPDDYFSYWNFDEGVGTVIGDDANKLNGTLTDGGLWASGYSNTCLVSDGTNYVDLGKHFNPYEISNEFTVCYWIKHPVDGDGSVIEPILDLGFREEATDPENQGLVFGIRSNGKPIFRVRQNTQTGYNGNIRGFWEPTSITVEADTWSFVVCQRNNTTGSLHIWTPTNGWETDSVNYTSESLSRWRERSHSILAWANASDDSISQIMSSGISVDELALYKKTLSSSERDYIRLNGIPVREKQFNPDKTKVNFVLDTTPYSPSSTITMENSPYSPSSTVEENSIQSLNFNLFSATNDTISTTTELGGTDQNEWYQQDNSIYKLNIINPNADEISEIGWITETGEIIKIKSIIPIGVHVFRGGNYSLSKAYQDFDISPLKSRIDGDKLEVNISAHIYGSTHDATTIVLGAFKGNAKLSVRFYDDSNNLIGNEIFSSNEVNNGWGIENFVTQIPKNSRKLRLSMVFTRLDGGLDSSFTNITNITALISPRTKIKKIRLPLINGNAEEDFTGWTIEGGVPEAYTSSNYAYKYGTRSIKTFHGGNSSDSYLTQVLDLTPYDVHSSNIPMVFEIRWWENSWDGDADGMRFYFRYYDQDGALITTTYFTRIYSGDWISYRKFRLVVPKNAATIKVYLHFDRASGTDNSSYADNLECYLLKREYNA